MGISASKLKALYLPAQSGKTRKVEDLIIHYKNIHECFGDGDVNIVISANNILLVKQTEARIKKDLTVDSEEGINDAIIKAGVFSWTSGEKECNISARELKDRVLEEEVEMVVLCAHATRLKYLSQMVNLLSSSKFFTKKINIWIDEADKSILLWSRYEAMLSLPAIHQVTLVSATFASVIAKYGQLQVLPFAVTHPSCYRRLKDAVKFEENFATADAVEYVKHVILKNREKLVRPGLRAFIPGEMRKASHDAIADFLHLVMGFIVIIINGERKEILVPGEAKIDLRAYLTVTDGKTPDEFNTQLAKLYKANNWSRFPLAITGFYCVERGVTFQCGPETDAEKPNHDGFLFDYGIIPPIAQKPDAYQTMARLFGNVGHLPNYKPVHIYSSSAMFNKVEKQEEMAVNISRIAFERKLETIGKKELKEAVEAELSDEWELREGEFSSLVEANNFCKRFGAKSRTNANLGHAGGNQDYATLKRMMKEWTTFGGFNMVRKGIFAPALGRVWKTLKNASDESSAVYICRVIQRK